MANVSEPERCAACGRPLPAQEGRGRQRRYCGATCRSAARRGRTRLVETGRTDAVKTDLTIASRKVSLDSVTGEGDVVEQVVAAAERFGIDWSELDPLVAVASARQLARAVDEALRAAVTRARDAGRTWQEIGDLLGTTRQAAFQRFGRPIDPRTGAPMTQETLPGAAEKGAAFFADLMAGRYETLQPELDDTVAQRLGPSGLANTAASVAALVGRYEGMGEPSARAMQPDYTIVDVPLRFEAGEMTGRVTYHPDGKVAGVFVLRPEFA